MKIIKTHIDYIRHGDTVIHNGIEKTVTGKDISNCSFMGRSIFGDCYKSGHQPVLKLVYKKFYKGRLIND